MERKGKGENEKGGREEKIKYPVMAVKDVKIWEFASQPYN